MSAILKVLLAAFLFAGVFTQNRICNHHLGFGHANWHQAIRSTETTEKFITQGIPQSWGPSIKRLAAQQSEQFTARAWANEAPDFKPQFAKNPSTSASSEPIEVNWRVLIDIEYKLKYFKELDMEMYSPVFSEAVQALHGKEVVIEGFVIPFDEAEELLSLSFNPYASCFFCGKASPASVISMYLKDKRKRYKMDDFRKFRGTLYLNQDDPNEFYYILRNAEEQK